MAEDRDHNQGSDDLIVALAIVIANRNVLLKQARKLLRHTDDCETSGPHWDWSRERQHSYCRVCQAAYDVEKPGHRHGCSCGYEALVTRIDEVTEKTNAWTQEYP